MNRPNNIKSRTLCSNYTMVTDKLSNQDNQNYNAYGIEIINLDKICTIPDISTNKQFVKAIIKMFNRRKLSPVHFREVIENMLP